MFQRGEGKTTSKPDFKPTDHQFASSQIIKQFRWWNICFATIYISLFLQTQTLAEFFLSLPVTKGEKSVTINGTWETWERGNLFTLVVHHVLIRLVPLILTFSHESNGLINCFSNMINYQPAMTERNGLDKIHKYKKKIRQMRY